MLFSIIWLENRDIGVRFVLLVVGEYGMYLFVFLVVGERSCFFYFSEIGNDLLRLVFFLFS